MMYLGSIDIKELKDYYNDGYNYIATDKYGTYLFREQPIKTKLGPDLLWEAEGPVKKIARTFGTTQSDNTACNIRNIIDKTEYSIRDIIEYFEEKSKFSYGKKRNIQLMTIKYLKEYLDMKGE